MQALEQRVDRLTARIDALLGSVGEVRDRVTKVTTRDLLRQAEVTNVRRVVEGLDDSRESVRELRETLGVLQQDVLTAVTVGQRLTVDGQPIDFNNFVERLPIHRQPLPVTAVNILRRAERFAAVVSPCPRGARWLLLLGAADRASSPRELAVSLADACPAARRSAPSATRAAASACMRASAILDGSALDPCAQTRVEPARRGLIAICAARARFPPAPRAPTAVAPRPACSQSSARMVPAASPAGRVADVRDQAD